MKETRILQAFVISILVFSLAAYFLNFNTLTGKAIETQDQETKELAKQPANKGYIIQLKGNPLITEKPTTLTKAVTRSAKPTQPPKVQIKAEHAKAKTEILSALKTNQITGMTIKKEKDIILGEFYNTFNGIALDITKEQALMIATLPSVKAVYPNLEVKALLMDSAPLVQANQTWQIDEDGNNCQETGKACLTGKDVTIGIIDTGVDYTHTDLGGSEIIERPMQKITQEQIFIIRNSSDDYIKDQQISMNNNRIAYYSANKITIHDFNDNTDLQIEAKDERGQLYLTRLFLKENLLVFHAYRITDPESGSSEGTLYYYNLQTNEQKAIEDIKYLGNLWIENGKVIYGKYNEIDQYAEIHVYDPTTETNQLIDKNYGIIPAPLASGKYIAYHTNGGRYDLAVLDTETNTYLKTNAENQGPLLDFSGDEILYLESNYPYEKYYTYNIITQESKIVGTTNDANSKMEGYSHKVSIGYWGFGGNIENETIFMSQKMRGNKINAYDKITNRTVTINVALKAGDFDAENNKACFVASDFNLYCHDYNKEDQYEPPKLFNKKVVGGYDVYNKDEDPMDDHGHGTHVAATAAGNGILTGIAPDAKVYAYKVLSEYGSGSFSDVIGGIERATDPNQDGNYDDHADIISLSLGANCGWYGGYVPYCGPDDPVSQSIDNAAKAGVIAVVAAGNSGSSEGTIGTPATAREAITVGATDKYDNLAYFSSRGPVMPKGKSFAIIKPDITAPGVDICAAQYDNWLNSQRCLDDKHISISGTSMATPHVSGAAALLKQKDKTLTPQEAKMILRSKSKSLGLPTNHGGYGRLDTYNAALFKGKPAIANIQTSGIIKTKTSIIGTASGKSFEKYTLYHSKTEDNWKEITTNTNPVENSVIAIITPEMLEPGINYLRLVVYNKEGESSEDRSIIIPDKLDYNRAGALCTEIPCIADNTKIGGRGQTEPNTPNTVSMTCTDGTQTWANLAVESIEIQQGTEPSQVNAIVKVTCIDDTNLNLVYKSPESDFTVIATKACSQGQKQFNIPLTLAETYGYHVIRASLQNYGTYEATCGQGELDDNDDVVLKIESPCTDTDKAKNPYELGKVISNGTEKTDNCIDENTHLQINEYYCDNGEIKSEEYTCEYGCATDETGKYIGQCKGDGKLLQCEDSDGKSNQQEYIKGTVRALQITPTGTEDAFSETDFCSDNNIIEWTCNKNKFQYKISECPERCKDGACTSNCKDSDGNNPFTRGTVEFNGKAYSDECTGTKKQVIEKACLNGRMINQVTDCTRGCDKGACKPNTCTDSDGNNINKKGNVNFNGEKYDDYCANKKTVVEYTCGKQKMIALAKYDCAKGCNNGKCN
ncbi:S8 family serine peptidase [Candidatus Woesearchaeota archaeon]|nr:S8 family serine peptidase [Candidatus Woesearchaeota archaeon]